MTWFRVDDQLPDNRKARSIRRSHPEKTRDSSPFGLWTLAGAWAGRQRNGGFVPAEVLEEWDDDATAMAARLVDAGLWRPDEVDDEPGYRFHDWNDMNPGVEAPDYSDAGAQGNHMRWHVREGKVSKTCRFCTDTDTPDSRPPVAPSRGRLAPDSPPTRDPESPRPDPTRPDPTAAARATTPPQPVDNDVAIDILASKLRRYTALTGIRTDKLKPHQAAAICNLIAIHGDQKLVDVAVRTLRRDDPPQTIQAFLAGWESIPHPGAPALALVTDTPCPAGGHTGTTRFCIQCASESKAAR
ncbi:hypothetical protein [Nocardioides sp. GY 10127]|uniref:hypothetical protein n=1 Tax=Nocardioides sp. GY 10127 TaxID=2569762 RepID=UPI0010A923FA|nr:hypothetical protein [Nocardioides sp. GY 10127]TIC78807.1 hypothetical protein E8D37_19110 [Nocardioides sp. GY 10127]